MNTEIKNTIVTFVLDRSGSMSSVKESVVSGVNEYVEKLKTDEEPTLIRLTAFDSDNIEVIYDFVDVNSARELKNSDYIPGNLTPLYDSIAEGIKATTEYLKNQSEDTQVIFTIMTDGIENSSKEYKRGHIFKMITEKEAQGWVFVYLGSNQDSWEVGKSIGIRPDFSANYDDSNTADALRTLGTSTRRARSSLSQRARVQFAFTTEERRKLNKLKNRQTHSNQ